MKPVSASEKEWLIEKGYLKLVNGKYENLTITRHKKFVADKVEEKLRFMKNK